MSATCSPVPRGALLYTRGLSETGTTARESPFSGRTAWARSLETPLRDVPAHRDRQRRGAARRRRSPRSSGRTSTPRSYERVWHDELSIRLGGSGVSQDLRDWVNSGLMTFFFFVVGLEARREFDLGELRERRRVALPLLAGLGGMVVPVAIYLADQRRAARRRTAGASRCRPTPRSRSGMLALVGPRFPDRLRAFLLTVVVVDDLVALRRDRDRLQRATSTLAPLLVAAGDLRRRSLVVRALGVRRGLVYALLGVGGVGGALEVRRRPGRRSGSRWAC